MKSIKIILFMYVVFATTRLYAGDIISSDSILAAIELNNTTLLSLKKQISADKIANKTGLLPDNPEIEFGYLWGSPTSIGNRKDLSVKQSLDFPTAYVYRNQISNLKNNQAELEYKKQKKEILLQARYLLADISYQNVLIEEYTERFKNASQLADHYKKKFDSGSVNILELNKAEVNLLNISKQLEVLAIEKESLIKQLKVLNGGKDLDIGAVLINTNFQLTDFETWYKTAELKNPLLQWIKQEVEINQKEEKLYRAESLPKIFAGYMSESVVGEKYQGVTVGLTIPLWENKNTVKHAKAKVEAVKSMEEDMRFTFYNEVKNLHSRAVSLGKNVNDFREKLKVLDNKSLLEKALDKGEISLSEYLVEMTLFYEIREHLYESEHEHIKTIQELESYCSW